MKTSSSPRVVCRIVRASLTVFGGESAATQNRHVAGCPDCQVFYGAADEFDALLRRDAVAQRGAAPAGLEAGILAAVRESRRTAPARPAPRRLAVPLFTLAGATAAAIAAFLYLQPPAAPAGADTPVAASDADVAKLAQDILGALPGDLLAEVQPRAEELLQRQDPLRTEAAAVAANARTALRYVAANFLPSDSQLLHPRSG